MKKRIWALVFAAAIVPLVHADTAAASDRKFYSAMGCVAYYGSDQPLFEYANHKIEHIGTGYNRSVVCPVIRDDTTDNPSITDFDVWVDGNAGYTTQCWGYAVSTSGNESTSDTDSTEFGGPVTLTFGADPDTFGDGHVYLRCSIPPRNGSNRAGVIGYSVTELSS